MVEITMLCFVFEAVMELRKWRRTLLIRWGRLDLRDSTMLI